MIQTLAKACGKTYGKEEKADVAMRVVADHLRAIAFAIADGQLPGNTGAGYVIRRILRRAVRYGYSFLGLDAPFIHALVPVLAEQMGEQYPELHKQRELIVNVVLEEERSFLRTLETGTKRLEQLIAESKGTLNGAKAFELLDTFGFPIDLTQLMAREVGVQVDMKGFEKELEKQKERSRAATSITTGDWTELAPGNTEFNGYDALASEARILRYRKVKDKAGDRFQIVLDRTPFYAEGGGQVGDQGWLVQGSAKVAVQDTRRENQLIIHLTNELPPDVAAPVVAQVDEHRRKLIRRNHTATHLLHHALRNVLGPHVEQKGSLVAPEKLRFDISHFAKISPGELAQVEAEVNAMVRADLALEEKRDVPVKKAMDMGAMALFGEKYGDSVRVIKFGDSIELCGGVHVPRTGEIGALRIVSEGALAAGIRRIEAITSEAADEYVEERLKVLEQLRHLLRDPKDPVAGLQALIQQHAELTKEVEKAALAKVDALQKTILAGATQKAGGRVVAKEVDLDANGMRELAFRLKDANKDLLLVLGAKRDGKALLAVMVGEGLQAKGLKATDAIKALAAEIKGGGGGQPFFATAGGKDPDGLERALAKAKDLLA